MVPALCARQAPVPQMSACARSITFATPSETRCLARNAGSRRHDHPPPDDDEGGQDEQHGVNRHLSPRILVSGYLVRQSPSSAFRCLSDSGRKVSPQVARGCGRIRAGRAARGAAGVVGYIIGFVVVGGINTGAVSWWNDNHWSSSSESNFLTSCEAQGPGVAYCECALHKVEQQYGPKESDSLVGNSAVANQIASYCAGQ